MRVHLLCFPRDLHLKVNKIPRLARNLHTMPATKSAPQGPQRAAPATKSALQDFKVDKLLHLPQGPHCKVHNTLRCACHKICTSRSTKYCACHELCTSRSTLRGPQSAAPATKSARQDSHHAALPRRRLRQHQDAKTRVFLRCLNIRATARKSRLTAPATNTKYVLTTTMSKVLHLPRNLYIDIKPLRSPAPVTKSTLDQVSVASATKGDHHVRKCARHHNESAVSKSTQQILRACAVEVHFEDLEVNECTVTRSELTGRPDESLRSNTHPLVWTHCLRKKESKVCRKEKKKIV